MTPTKAQRAALEKVAASTKPTMVGHFSTRVVTALLLGGLIEYAMKRCPTCGQFERGLLTVRLTKAGRAALKAGT